MLKQKLKAIIANFISFEEPASVKETVREMYDIIMLSEQEISVEQRKRFTHTCMNLEELMSGLNAITKKLRKELSRKARES